MKAYRLLIKYIKEQTSKIVEVCFLFVQAITGLAIQINERGVIFADNLSVVTPPSSCSKIITIISEPWQRYNMFNSQKV